MFLTCFCLAKKGNSIVLIENKIFSGEGWEQTNRYASEEFKYSLVQYLHDNEMIGTLEPQMAFFYLTLDGDKPASPDFKILQYSDISASIPNELSTSKRDILLQELKENIDEYYNWKAPEEDDVIIDYLKRAERLVSPHKAFYTMVEQLNIDEKFKKDFYVTGNPGSGYIPACDWHKMPQWKGTSCKESDDGSTCFQINISFQWETKDDSFTLYLEYTTSPYQTRKQLAAYDESFLNDYKHARQLFYEHVKNSNIDKWTIKKTPLRIASANFDKNITFGELKENISELTASATDVVDDWFQLKCNE